MSLDDINQLRHNLSSLIESDHRNDADKIQQMNQILTQLDSYDLNKELIIQSKIALTISKIISKIKDDNTKKLSENLLHKIMQIAKTKSGPQCITNDTKNSQKDKYFKHFLNTLKEIKIDKYTKNPESIALQIAENLEKCDNSSTKFTFLINLITDNKKEEIFHFRKKLLRGQLAPEEFVKLTKQDILTENEKEKIKLMKEENMNRAMVPKPPPISSQMYKCKFCKGKNVSYRQLQMLAADEPMTVIFFCGDCGETWKK